MTNPWVCSPYSYDTSTGSYIGQNYLNINGSNIPGEYLFVQSDKQFVPTNYTMNVASSTLYSNLSPVSWYFCGSNDGVNWTSVQQIQSYTQFPSEQTFTVNNPTIYFYYAFLFTSAAPNPLGAIRINQIKFEGGFSFSTSKTFQILSNVYTTNPGYIQRINFNLGTFSSEKILTSVYEFPIVEVYSSNLILMGTSTDVRLFRIDNATTSNISPVPSAVLSTTSDGTNIYVSYDGNIRRYDLTSNDYNQLGIWSKTATSISEKLNQATQVNGNLYALTDNTLVHVTTSTNISLGTQKYKRLLTDTSNIFVLPSQGNQVKRIVGSSIQTTYTLPETASFYGSLKNSNVYLGSNTNNIYSITTGISQLNTTPESYSFMCPKDSNVFFFSDSNILVYNEASQNFTNVNIPPSNLIFSSVTSSYNGFMISGNNLINMTDGIQKYDDIWYSSRGFSVYKMSSTQFTNALEWKRNGSTPQSIASSISSSNVFNPSAFSVFDMYLTSSGSTNVIIQSNANVYAYYNSTLTHESSRYFKLELSINGRIVQTYDGLYSNANQLASLLSNIKSHNSGTFSVGFTNTTSSQFIVKVFGAQGSNVITISGLTSIGAISNTATLTNGTTISITPASPVGLSNTLSLTAYSPFQIYADGPFSINVPFAFTENTATTVGSRYTPSPDGKVFATASFIPRFANNFIATGDNSLILKFDSNVYTRYTVNQEFSSSLPLYKNVYSYGDTLYFYSASDGSSLNLIGVFDSVNQTMKHINVYQYCSSGEVYSLVYNSGILYALSGNSSVSNIVYIVGTSVFNISDFATHDQITGSVVSGSIADGVFFAQKTRSNIVALNTTTHSVYNVKLDTDICDLSSIGSTSTYFYGPGSSKVYSIDFDVSVNTLTISTYGLKSISSVIEYNSSTYYSNSTHVIQNSTSNSLGTTITSNSAFIFNGILHIPSNNSNDLVFFPTFGGARLNRPYSRIQKPLTSNVYSVNGSNVYMYSNYKTIFNLDTRTISLTDQYIGQGAKKALWVNDTEYICFSDAVKNLTTGNNFIFTETITDISSDSVNRLIVLCTSNVFQIYNDVLFTSPVSFMNVVTGTTFINNASVVSYTPTTPTTVSLGPHNAYELNIVGSNVYAQLDKSIVSFSNDLKYYCEIAPLDGVPIDSVYFNSNLVYLTQGEVIYINPLQGTSTSQTIPDKYGQQIITDGVNTIYIPSTTDINLLRLPSNTETTRRFINTTATKIGSSFYAQGNVYSFADNNQTLVFSANSLPGYSQTFPFSNVQNSTYLNGKIYYGLSSNIIQQDTSKDFWLTSTYSNITGTIQNISSLSTYGKNVIGGGTSTIYIYDTVNSNLLSIPNATNGSQFFAFDGKSFLYTKSNYPYVSRYTPNTIGTFTTYDAVPPIVPDSVKSLAFDGKYLYTMSNIVYTLDTSNLSQYILTRQPDFPLLSNVVGGFYDGRAINVYLSNTYFQYDLSPFTLNANCSMSAIVQYAYLSEEEKRWMNSGPLDYVVTQVQQSIIDDGYYMVDFLNPTKEFILTGPLDALTVFTNGNLLVNPDTRYMSNVNQLQYHSRRSTFQNTYPISFSLAPEKNIPSGHINLSRIKEKVFASETQGPVNIFSLSHNIFRARDGLGGLVFNNRFN